MTSSMRCCWISASLIVLLSNTGCTAVQEASCAARVKEHLASFEQTYAKAKVTSIEQARQLASSLHAAASTAPTDGCSSQVILGVAELTSAATDLQTALSDENVLVGGLFSLFGAGEASPIVQKIEAAQQRYEGARRLLSEAAK